MIVNFTNVWLTLLTPWSEVGVFLHPVGGNSLGQVSTFAHEVLQEPSLRLCRRHSGRGEAGGREWVLSGLLVSPSHLSGWVWAPRWHQPPPAFSSLHLALFHGLQTGDRCHLKGERRGCGAPGDIPAPHFSVCGVSRSPVCRCRSWSLGCVLPICTQHLGSHGPFHWAKFMGCAPSPPTGGWPQCCRLRAGDPVPTRELSFTWPPHFRGPYPQEAVGVWLPLVGQEGP